MLCGEAETRLRDGATNAPRHIVDTIGAQQRNEFLRMPKTKTRVTMRMKGPRP